MFIFVFCKSEKSISINGLIEIIEKENYFDGPQYEFGPDAVEASDEDWGYFRIIYAPDTPPIEIERETDRGQIDEYVEETIEEIEAVQDGEEYAGLIDALRATRQVFVFDVRSASLTEEAWKAIDRLESNWAEKLDGYIYVPGEGLYDHFLRRICNMDEQAWRDLSLIRPHGEIEKKDLRSLDVFCLSGEPYDVNNIFQFFLLSGGFDEDPVFTPKLGELGDDWRKLAIDIKAEEQISIYRYTSGDADFDIVLEETRQIQRDRLDEMDPAYEQHLVDAAQILSIVYHEPSISQDAEQVTTNIAFSMAEELEGLISVYEGFYDEERDWLNG